MVADAGDMSADGGRCDTPDMKIKFVAGVTPICADPAASAAFYNDLGVVFESDDGDGYKYTTALEGLEHLGIWPLRDAAMSCFGSSEWPADLPVPQVTIEFEVEDVSVAEAELVALGHTLLHGTRREEWGQTTARLLSPEGVLVGVVSTPGLS
jgi:catechol 2,3-dioxygenase-like lactoylglutathione lyase family enzyme